jgi:hypothetical protein
MESPITSYDCPSCQRPLSFRHSETNLIVCPACQMPVQRLDGDVLVEKPITVLSFRNEVIQIGTAGVWNGQKFEVIGRIRFWFNESVFNYWNILFDDGTLTYLGEGYGLYGLYKKVSFNREVKITELVSMSYDSAGRKFINETPYYLERKYVSFQFEIEGEVIMPITKTPVKTFELSAEDGRHIEIIGFGNELVYCYSVTYTDFNTLQLTNTSKAVYKAKEVTCSSCHSKSEFKTYPYALSFFCEKCYNRIDVRNNRIAGRNKDKCPEPYISLRSKGMIKGVQYLVLGYALKEENNRDAARWVEFTLHNPEEGYAFLSEYDGNFILVKEDCNSPVVTNTRVERFYYGDEEFVLYNRYIARLLDARGEFPCNFFNDGSINANEYISPPEMWISEKSNDEGKHWFFAQHLSRREVEAAFGENLPPKGTIGAIEPKGYLSPKKLAMFTALAVLLAIFMHLVMGFTTGNKILLDSTFSFPDSTNAYGLATSRFELKKWKSNLEFEIVAPVYNSWFELSGTLVNAQTGTEYSFEQGIEYYEGYEGGEHWTEGDRSATFFLSSIPAGTYYMQLIATKESRSDLKTFSLALKNDVSMGRNLFFVILFLLIWPVIKFMQVYYTERERWYNSPFTPYTYEN